MSYKLVDAVNQQFPLPHGSADLLILTKFAERITNDRVATQCMGLDCFMAITRMDRKTVKRHLESLHKKGYLVCLDKEVQKHIGDYPHRYKLILPEGFNEEVIDQRRRKYYGGMPFKPAYYVPDDEPMNVAAGAGVPLSPVIMRHPADNLSATEDNLSAAKDNLSAAKDNLSAAEDKMTPLKNTIIENDNNNVVVVDSSLSEFYHAAAVATVSSETSFANLGVTTENVKWAMEAVELYKMTISRNLQTVKSNPVGYLRCLIVKAIQSGGVKALVGEVRSPAVSNHLSAEERKRQQVSEAVQQHWTTLCTDFKLHDILSEADIKKAENVFRTLTIKGKFNFAAELANCFVEDFRYDNPDNFSDAGQFKAAFNKFVAQFYTRHHLDVTYSTFE